MADCARPRRGIVIFWLSLSLIDYYRQLQERVIELMQARYSRNLVEVQQFTRKYDVDFWILEQAAFPQDYVAERNWMHQFQPAFTQAKASVQQKSGPALAQLTERCAVLKAKDLVVLQANCIWQQSQVNLVVLFLAFFASFATLLAVFFYYLDGGWIDGVGVWLSNNGACGIDGGWGSVDHWLCCSRDNCICG